MGTIIKTFIIASQCIRLVLIGIMLILSGCVTYTSEKNSLHVPPNPAYFFSDDLTENPLVVTVYSVPFDFAAPQDINLVQRVVTPLFCAISAQTASIGWSLSMGKNGLSVFGRQQDTSDDFRIIVTYTVTDIKSSIGTTAVTIAICCNVVSADGSPLGGSVEASRMRDLSVHALSNALHVLGTEEPSGFKLNWQKLQPISGNR
jgi:hypothetical protein